jgi:DNA-binding NtrC family response regulator
MLEMAEYDKNKAAAMLDLSLSSLYRKMTELGIAVKD